MLAKDIIKALRKLMQDLCTLHIMRDIGVLKKKPIEKSSGLLRLLTECKQGLQNIKNSIGVAQKN